MTDLTPGSPPHAQTMAAVERLAHDFNNLLLVITGYSHLLLEDLAADDPRRDDAAQIRDAADRAAGLTTQLLAISRGQTAVPAVPTGSVGPSPPAVGQALPRAQAPRGTVGGSETVLVVEDEEAVRRVARLCLQTRGYTVLEAADGAAAVTLASTHPEPIHLLVTDVVMPGMGGRDLADALRARDPAMKVVFVSGYFDDRLARQGVFVATDNFLQKPFTPTKLAATVRAVLDAG